MGGIADAPAQRIDQAVSNQLVELAARSTGFQKEAVRPRVVQQVLRKLLASGWTLHEIGARAIAEDPMLLDMLHRVVAVGETFLFRQPEHFTFVAQLMRDGGLLHENGVLRAWSAGCATGEEAYSLASALSFGRGGDRSPEISVLGTDLLEQNLELARLGRYGARSIRSSGMPFPLLNASGEVDPRLRAAVSFSEHNLLHPLPRETRPFQLVMCRNVLVYFSEPALWQALGHLVDAVVPGGLLIFGTMDLATPPASLAPVGPRELAIYRRVPRVTTLPPPPSRRSLLSLYAPPAAEAPSEPLLLHLKALSRIENGDVSGATTILAELCRSAADYIPGLMERALLHLRSGERRAGERLLRRILELAGPLESQRILTGPEPLPVRFYTDSVRALLARGE